jgi:drug/metabolite transporter (DMT)-like permease
MGVWLALVAALSYGVGDFVGGVGGRRTEPALIPIGIQTVGLVAALVAVAVLPGNGPTVGALSWGAISGIGSGIGNAALFRGFARGQMSVVAPLSAVLTAALPVVVGLVTGDRLSPSGWAGLVLALPAIFLVSWSGAAGFRLADLGYGLPAGGGFGLLFIALDRAGTEHGAWPLLPGQLVALLIALAAAIPVLRRPRYRRWQPWAGVLRWSVSAGLLGAAANYCFLAATGAGQLTIAAVLAGLYPAVTVLLAMLILRERPRLAQAAGLVGAGAAVVAMAAG